MDEETGDKQVLSFLFCMLRVPRKKPVESLKTPEGNRILLQNQEGGLFSFPVGPLDLSPLKGSSKAGI